MFSTAATFYHLLEVPVPSTLYACRPFPTISMHSRDAKVPTRKGCQMKPGYYCINLVRGISLGRRTGS